MLVPVDDRAGLPRTDGARPMWDICPRFAVGGTFEFVCVSMGNPHAVTARVIGRHCPTSCSPLVLRKSLSTPAHPAFPPLLRGRIPYFPRKPTSGFASVTDEGASPMRAYGRGGCGETLASRHRRLRRQHGRLPLVGPAGENDLLLSGGLLHLLEQDGTISMTGPATGELLGEPLLLP